MIKVKFDGKRLKNVIGIRGNPNLLLGLEEKYLKNYMVWGTAKFIDENNLSTKGIATSSLHSDYIKITDKILASDQFKKYIKTKENAQILFYSTSPSNFEKLSRTAVATALFNRHELTSRIENKADFRELFKEDIPFPDFKIIEKNTIDSSKTTYELIYQEFGKFVMQDEKLSMNKGTFIVDNYSDFIEAVVYLKTIENDRIIISKFINGKDIGVQVCITSQGNLISPIQEQLVRIPKLCKMDKPNASKFCGGQWGYYVPSKEASKKLFEIANRISKKLYSLGYRGMFGIDAMITEDHEVFIFEVNARFVSTSAALNSYLNSKDIPPLILFHVLALAEVDFTIENYEFDDYYPGSVKHSYIHVYNQLANSIGISSKVKNGVYAIINDKIQFVKYGYSLNHLENEKQFIILNIMNKNHVNNIEPGIKIGSIHSYERIIDSNLQVLPKFRKVLKFMRQE